DRDQPRPLAPTRPRLPRTQTSRRQKPQRGLALPQTPPSKDRPPTADLTSQPQNTQPNNTDHTPALDTGAARRTEGTSSQTAGGLDPGRFLLRFRLRDDAQPRPGRLPLAEELLRLVVRDRTRDDHVLALLPVHRRRDLVLRRQLERVDHPQHLVEVAASR